MMTVFIDDHSLHIFKLLSNDKSFSLLDVGSSPEESSDEFQSKFSGWSAVNDLWPEQLATTVPDECTVVDVTGSKSKHMLSLLR